MTESEWPFFLGDFSRELLADSEIRRRLPPEVVERGGLGFPPATDETIAAAEARLGVRFPPTIPH